MYTPPGEYFLRLTHHPPRYTHEGGIIYPHTRLIIHAVCIYKDFSIHSLEPKIGHLPKPEDKNGHEGIAEQPNSTT